MSGGAFEAQSPNGSLTVTRIKRGPKRKWTREENDRIAHLYDSGVRPIEIARQLETTPDTVKAKLKDWGMGGKFRRAVR